MQETPVGFLGQEDPLEESRQPTRVLLEFSGGPAGKESACNAGDLCLIPGLGRSPGEGKGYPLQYSGLDNFMDYIVHGVAKSRAQLSIFHFLLDKYIDRTVSIPLGNLKATDFEKQT